MSEKLYHNILKSGIFLSFISFFLVKKTFYFPFITTKQLFFNILIEVLLVFWLALIIKYPSSRPKKSFITHGLAAFFIVLLISCFAGVDFNLSFWGDLERMLGWFHIIHFFIFYLILITVIRTRRDWEFIFGTSLLTAVGIVLFGFYKHNNISTIGNAAYIAGLMIFNFYFALFLILKNKSWLVKSLSFLALIFVLIGFFKADISGAQAGLVISFLLAGFLFSLLNKNKKIKTIGLSLFSLLIIALISLFIFKNSHAFDDSRIGKMLRDFSSSNVTLNTRLISWRAAAKGFKEHPIIGTGYGNYAIIFDKYFSHKYYDYTLSEEYFDRAHNNLIDIATTSGILGLLAYLSIFVSLGYYLIKGYRAKKIDLVDFVLVSGVILGYFIHNLAVFDALVNYVLLMITLGFVYYLCNKDGEIKYHKSDFDNKEILSIFLIGVSIFFIIYQYNIKTIKMVKSSVVALKYYRNGDVLKAMDEYKKTFSYSTLLQRDAISSYTGIVSSDQDSLAKLKIGEREDYMDYVVSLAKINVNYNKNDVVANMHLAQVLDVAGFLTNNVRYEKEALEAINKSIENGREHIPSYLIKSNIYLRTANFSKAKENLEEAMRVAPNYYDLYCYMTKVDYFYDKKKYKADIEKNIDICIKKDRIGLLGAGEYINETINRYNKDKNLTGLIKIYEYVTKELDPKNPEFLVALINLYKQTNQLDKANEAVDNFIKIAPEQAGAIKNFLKE